MFETLWLEFQTQIVPFLPHIFSFALILFPVAFLSYINWDVKDVAKIEE